MDLQWLEPDFSVCQVADASGLDLTHAFTFVSRTDQEISVVCPSDFCPENCLAIEPGWRCFRIVGHLDFSLLGILADISSVLARAQISVFAISTFDTDYILVRLIHQDAATRELEAAGHPFV